MVLVLKTKIRSKPANFSADFSFTNLQQKKLQDLKPKKYELTKTKMIFKPNNNNNNKICTY
jgi:hypothetical protein